MPTPLPLPQPWSVRLALPGAREAPLPRGVSPSLISAVAAVVAIAAERARAAGTLDDLREAVQAALAPDRA
jgi:hypothetical protein